MFVFPSLATRRLATAPSVSRAVAHLFDDTYFRDRAEPRVPAMDVSESDTAYTLTLDLPGLTKDQLKVSVQGRRVAIEAGTPAEASATAAEGQTTLYRERTAARYARTVSLPAEVDPTSSAAKFENGVLTLTLVKRVPSGASLLNIS